MLRKAAYLVLCLALSYQLVTLGRTLGFSPSMLGTAFAPDAGVPESVPPAVVEAGTLIRRNALPDFSLSPALSSDPVFFQRIIEYSYPARFNAKASASLARDDEIAAAQCKRLDRAGVIAMCAAR